MPVLLGSLVLELFSVRREQLSEICYPQLSSLQETHITVEISKRHQYLYLRGSNLQSPSFQKVPRRPIVFFWPSRQGACQSVNDTPGTRSLTRDALFFAGSEASKIIERASTRGAPWRAEHPRARHACHPVVALSLSPLPTPATPHSLARKRCRFQLVPLPRPNRARSISPVRQ